MSTYTQILYQFVFGPKGHKKVLIAENRTALFSYINGILKEKKCHVYRINGIEDHIHILTHVHPSVAVADLIKDIKMASSVYIKANNLFPGFIGWQEGYGAFTYSAKDRERLIEYVKNQEEHHRRQAFRAEYASLLKEHDIDPDVRYFP